MSDDEIFEQSESEASLRRIAESVRALEQAESEWMRTGLELAEAKDEHKKTKSLVARLRQELYDTSRGETKEMPLFPVMKPAPEKSGDTDGANRCTLLLVPGIPSIVANALADRGINTIGDLADFTNGGGKLTDLKGIRQDQAEKTLAALDEFWKSWGQG